ncbi:MAG: hypothetical protein ACKOUM_05405, partial [Sphingopyxis sp.]
MTFSHKTLLGLTASAAAVLAPGAAGARVISNVANAHWTGPGGTAQTVRSNQVDVEVQAQSIATQVAIYRINSSADSSSAGEPSRIDGSGCSSLTASTTTSPVSAAASLSAPDPTSVMLPLEDSFTAGEPVAFGVRSAADNLDAAVRDSFDVTVRTATGDVETVRLREDATNSGFFVGYLATVRMPPAVVQHDCRLSVSAGAGVRVSLYREGTADAMASAQVSFLVDPYGVVFDSGDGSPVGGARVTLIDVATGQPANVYGDDGVSTYPNSVITGQTVTDGGGTIYTFPTGDYRFPLVAPGTYRLVVQAPTPYSWASAATPAELASFQRTDTGEPYTINGASYGAAFQLFTPAPVRVDIPVDQPNLALTLRKAASVATAVPGDVVQYRLTLRNGDARRSTGAVTVRDQMPAAMRLRAGSLRYNGVVLAATPAPDGAGFTATLPALAAGQIGLLTYLGEVRPNARAGDAVNTASATDSRGSTSNVADATVRIHRDILGDRIVIQGRITNGGCGADPAAAQGIGGVRVMLQDGSFAVTDADGRYHFEGVMPGLHVVQIDPASLPRNTVPLDCATNTRAAGNAMSRFVEGRGGEMKRADFHAASIASPEAPVDAVAHDVAPVAAPPRPAVAE